MRLLHVKSYELTFYPGKSRPKYAILSHTWGADEVSYDDLVHGNAVSKEGYSKIVGACAVAANAGYDYVWIDAVCIDKSSSAELSEAINSMFRWYEEADICYAFLEDLKPLETPTSHSIFHGDHFYDLTQSRWWSRGWTLQELLAPKDVTFLSHEWDEIGKRSSEAHAISSVHKIPEVFLHAELGFEGSPGVLSNRQRSMQRASVAQRMSWASSRITTRAEDIAYCLLGIFGVNMALLYGEGETNAFYRLQEQVFNQYDDQSILAWSPKGTDERRGWLANHPSEFKCAGKIARLKGRSTDYTVSERGLEIALPIKDFLTRRTVGVLNCYIEDDLSGYVCLNLLTMLIDKPDKLMYQREGGFHIGEGEQSSSRRIFIPRDPSLYSSEAESTRHLVLNIDTVDLWFLDAYPLNRWNEQSTTFLFQHGERPRAVVVVRYKPSAENLAILIDYDPDKNSPRVTIDRQQGQHGWSNPDQAWQHFQATGASLISEEILEAAWPQTTILKTSINFARLMGVQAATVSIKIERRSTESLTDMEQEDEEFDLDQSNQTSLSERLKDFAKLTLNRTSKR